LRTMPVGAPDYQVNVRLVEQLKALLNMPHWYTVLVLDKDWVVGLEVPPGEIRSWDVYEFPPDWRFMLSDVAMSSQVLGLTTVFLDFNDVISSFIGSYGSTSINLHRPARYEAGDKLRVTARNYDATTGYLLFSLLGWMFPASTPRGRSSVNTASEAYKSGLWNYCSMRIPEDGVCEARISGVQLKETYTFKVRSLYRSDEEIVEDEEVEIVKFPRRLA